MKVLVAGAGAIGGWLGARLADHHDVTLLGRPDLQKAVAAAGLQVSGHTTWSGPVEVITEPTGRYDMVVLTCKAHQTASLGKLVAPLADGPIVSLQNGLGNGEKLAHLVGRDRVGVALTSHGVAVDRPGVLRHAGRGTTKVGALGDEATGRIAESLLTDAGLQPVWTQDIRAAVWEKAIVNAGINPVATLLGAPNGAILADREALRRARQLVDESTALAEAAGVSVASEPWVTTRTVLERTAENRCSMVQDVAAKRPTEIEQLTGRMVRMAGPLHVAMPESADVYARVKGIEAGYLGAARARAMADDERRFDDLLL